MPQLTAFIQARMGSTRFPGKALLPLGNSTVLEQVIGRVREAKLINEIILVTTSDNSDDALAETAKKLGIKYFRGGGRDVLESFYRAAQEFKVSHLGRVTGDCPLIDPEVIDLAAKKYLEGSWDYVGVNRPLGEETYPDGLDVEIFSFAALERARKEAKLSSEREHVTPYIWKNPDKFKIFSVKSPVDLSSYRLTLDHLEDYEVIKKIYENVKPLRLENIIDFIKAHPEIKTMNADRARDESYHKQVIIEGN
ncbi:MAG: glycosyltransferase family protein [bacterium]|nr:glycosyltransferase family protein [bacterium]